VKIRRLGSSGRFHEFDDDDDDDACPWCEAARRYFNAHPEMPEGETVHLENDRGRKRTVTLTHAEPIGLLCEPYVFFRDDE